MKKYLPNVLCALFVVFASAFQCFVWFAPQKLYASEPMRKAQTAEFRKGDSTAGKLEKLADKEDKKDVEITKLSDQVYRVDVKSTTEGLKEYESALVQFCKDHSDSSVCRSPAPINLKGNTGGSVWYWTVNKK